MEARSTQNTRWYRAKSWLKRAGKLRKDDLDGRFIFCWIALSALYGQARTLLDPDPKDREGLAIFLSNILKLEVAAKRIRSALLDLRKEAMAILGSEFLVEGYWKGGLTEKVQRTLSNGVRRAEREWNGGTPDRCLTNLFMRLYLLRNQLVHGFSTDGAKANRESLKAAVPLLRSLLPVFLWAARRYADDLELGDPPYPPKGWQGHPEYRRPALNPPTLVPKRDAS